MNKPIIEIKDLSYKIGNNTILDNITTKLYQGEFITIIGPNGAGKTTLIELLIKIIDQQQGSILIQGENIKKLNRKTIAKKIAYVPQSINFDYEFTVEETVLMGRLPYQGILDKYNEQDYKIVEQAMKLTNISLLKDRNICTLSGGEAQRVAIARAIAQKTPILILDEPISNLDIYQQIEIMEILKKLNKEENITVISILHDINTSLRYSDKTILLKNGKLVNQGKSENIITKDSLRLVFGVNVNIIQKNDLKIAVY